MKAIERLPFRQWADINRTEKFISIEPLSGYRRALREDDGHAIYLMPDATNAALGEAVLQALDKSRFIWPPDEREFFAADRIMLTEQNWHKDVVRRYAYKTKRDLYKNMNWVRAKRSEGKISIRPHQRRDKPGEWLWLSPDQKVVIPETCDAAALGSALRLAFDRCE
ncbi:MAG TPA: contact-dependent growth inhibition system immunity protein [Stellaceae bacterium]|jgi:hypothetical protein